MHRRILAFDFDGTLADKVLRGATVPVLMYRPREGGGEG